MKYNGFIIVIVILLFACNGNKKEQEKTSDIGIIYNTEDLEFYSDENLEKIRKEFYQKLSVIENINGNESIHNEIKILWKKIWEYLENDSKLQKIWLIVSEIKSETIIRTSEQEYKVIDSHLEYNFGLNYEEAKQLEKEFMEIFDLSWDELNELKFIVYRKYNEYNSKFPEEEDMKCMFWRKYKWE